METKCGQSVWLVIVMDCQNGNSCHQQDRQVLEGYLCSKGQAAVQ